MTTEVIHKLNITAEASLDIKECLVTLCLTNGFG